jgi:hypothetical protein
LVQSQQQYLVALDYSVVSEVNSDATYQLWGSNR